MTAQAEATQRVHILPTQVPESRQMNPKQHPTTNMVLYLHCRDLFLLLKVCCVDPGRIQVEAQNAGAPRENTGGPGGSPGGA